MRLAGYHLAVGLAFELIGGDTTGEIIREVCRRDEAPNGLDARCHVLARDPRCSKSTPISTRRAAFEEVRHAATALREAMTRYRSGERAPGAGLRDPRPK